MRARTRTWTLCCAAALAALCLAPRGAGRARGDGVRITSNDGAWVVEYALDATPPPLNAPFGATVRLLPASGEWDFPGVSLAVDARMPQHRHGMRVEPRVEALGEGRFRVDGLVLHMPGRWELYFDVTRGALTERAQDAVELD